MIFSRDASRGRWRTLRARRPGGPPPWCRPARARKGRSVRGLVRRKQPDETARADRSRLVRAVNAIHRAADIERARPHRIAGTAGHEARQVRLALDHLGRRTPVGPLRLAVDALQARSIESPRGRRRCRSGSRGCCPARGRGSAPAYAQRSSRAPRWCGRRPSGVAVRLKAALQPRSRRNPDARCRSTPPRRVPPRRRQPASKTPDAPGSTPQSEAVLLHTMGQCSLRAMVVAAAICLTDRYSKHGRGPQDHRSYSNTIHGTP